MRFLIFALFLGFGSAHCQSRDLIRTDSAIAAINQPIPVASVTKLSLSDDLIIGSWVYHDMKELPDLIKNGIEKNNEELEFKFFTGHKMMWIDGSDTAYMYWKVVQPHYSRTQKLLLIYQPIGDNLLHPHPATLTILKIKKKKFIFQMTYDAVEELKEPFTVIFKRKS